MYNLLSENGFGSDKWMVKNDKIHSKVRFLDKGILKV